MKTFSKKLIFFLFLVPMLMVISCKDSDDPAPAGDDFEILSTYLVDNDLDLPDILNGWITAAPIEDGVSAFVSDNYILDIRSATDFGAGHIQGAVNSTLGTILEDASNANGKPIVVVCYTGQTAGHAVVALRLSGYADAKVLKFGMSGWNSNYDKWSANTGDMGIGHENWTTTATSDPSIFSAPTLTVTATDGAGILAERVSLLTSGGLRGINNSDVLASPSSYQINNYWDEADIVHYGCIDGSNRIKPLSLANEEFLKLDPSETIVTYCWTGQTSSMVTAYLYVIGYDSKSLKFGVNGMIYSDLESHKFSTPLVDLPVVTE